MTECAHPVTIHANTLSVSGEYGQKSMTVNCGSRIAEDCEHCSKIYRGDSFTLLRDGFAQLQPGEQAFFVTTTAPGSAEFGQTHGIRRGQRCPCGALHRKGDEILGTPIDADAYRYDLAAGFNKASSRLFTLGIQRLRRFVRDDGGTVRYIRVAEYQRRGLIHMHAIIITTADDGMIRRAYQGGPSIRGVWRRHTPVSHEGFTWGTRMDIQKIGNSADEGKVRAYMAKLVGYVAKGLDHGLHGVHKTHAATLQAAALRHCKCDRLSSGCLRGRYRHTGGAPRSRTGPNRSGGAENLCRRHARAWNMAGFTGHVFGRGASWGPKTRALCRAIRAEHVRNGISQDIAERSGETAAQQWLDEIDAPTWLITATKCTISGREDDTTEHNLTSSQLLDLIDSISRQVVDEAELRAGKPLSDAFIKWADDHLPAPIMCCLECGQPSEPEICPECEHDAFELEHPTLDRRDAERIVWGIAQKRLHLDHGSLTLESAWWAEAELYSAPPTLHNLAPADTLF